MVETTIKPENISGTSATVNTQLITDLYFNNDLMDDETRAHSTRVGWYSYLLAKQMGYSDFGSRQIMKGAMLHDIGKYKVPDHIENKPAKLTAEEYEIVKRHCEDGLDVALKFGLSTESETDMVYANIILRHHEKYDGTGYPGKLSGSDIPVEANLVSVADIFDALLSKRCYKEPWSERRVINYINERSGKSFYPELVDAFNKIRHALIAVKRHFDAHSTTIQHPAECPSQLATIMVDQNIYTPFVLPPMKDVA